MVVNEPLAAILLPEASQLLYNGHCTMNHPNRPKTETNRN